MDSPYLSLSRNLERLLLFISGIIVSATVESLLEKSISWSLSILILSVVALIAGALFLMFLIRERVESLLDKSETVTTYTEEAYKEGDGIAFHGSVYNELKRLVENASQEILNVSSSFNIVNQPTREGYLKAIQDKIEKNSIRSYVRINQVPAEHLGKPLSEYLNGETRDHCCKVIKLSYAAPQSRPDVCIMSSPVQRQNSFLIVDNRHLVIELDGVDQQGNSYPVGMLFIDDKGGKLIRQFRAQFRELERLGTRVTLSDLNPAEKSN